MQEISFEVQGVAAEPYRFVFVNKSDTKNSRYSEVTYLTLATHHTNTTEPLWSLGCKAGTPNVNAPPNTKTNTIEPP